MTIITRFAPSPTGNLHIGGARTALFNALYAKAKGGQYFLRIEDTDRARSTEESVRAVLDGLGWLGLLGDAPPIYQSQNAARHKAVAEEMLARGTAFKCYCTQEELATRREMADAALAKSRDDTLSDADRQIHRQTADTLLAAFRSPWRDADTPQRRHHALYGATARARFGRYNHA